MASQQGSGGGVRARLRAETIREVKAVAKQQLSTEGANLSLRAIAREMGLVSSALYRYFPSRDQLLTALILDAYTELGDAAEAGDEPGAAPRARWIGVARAIRSWALAHPAEYALLYGTPVPGYRAPRETVVQANRPVVMLGRIVAEAQPVAPPPIETGPVLAAQIRDTMAAIAPIGEALAVRGLISWTHLFGAINFELFGRLDNAIDAREEWFDVQMNAMADYLGL